MIKLVPLTLYYINSLLLLLVLIIGFIFHRRHATLWSRVFFIGLVIMVIFSFITRVVIYNFVAESTGASASREIGFIFYLEDIVFTAGFLVAVFGFALTVIKKK